MDSKTIDKNNNYKDNYYIYSKYINNNINSLNDEKNVNNNYINQTTSNNNYINQTHEEHHEEEN